MESHFRNTYPIILLMPWLVKMQFCVCLCFWASSLSGKTFYNQILWSHEFTKLDVIMILSLWNYAGTSIALLSMCLSNVRAIGKVSTRNSRLRDFTRSCGKTSVCSVNKGPSGLFRLSYFTYSPANQFSHRTFLTWTKPDNDDKEKSKCWISVQRVLS